MNMCICFIQTQRTTSPHSFSPSLAQLIYPSALGVFRLILLALQTRETPVISLRTPGSNRQEWGMGGGTYNSHSAHAVEAAGGAGKHHQREGVDEELGSRVLFFFVVAESAAEVADHQDFSRDKPSSRAGHRRRAGRASGTEGSYSACRRSHFPPR